ncbi:MAG: acylphosphatase [Nanoarchaeota archaeon]|nr:acylphosphatase [Nanoarchaeota archaeon]MBU1103080.1 acylphosphatase [Nanoarchaeota archaeon]
MKKSIRLSITGSVQGMFFEQFVSGNADKLGVRGYLRKLENGKVEVFIEGDGEKVDEMVAICKRGTQHTQIRNVEEKPETFQDFKEFKILRI